VVANRYKDRTRRLFPFAQSFLPACHIDSLLICLITSKNERCEIISVRPSLICTSRRMSSIIAIGAHMLSAKYSTGHGERAGPLSPAKFKLRHCRRRSVVEAFMQWSAPRVAVCHPKIGDV